MADFNIHRNYQPDVYNFASYLQKHFQCAQVFEVKMLLPYTSYLYDSSQREAFKKKIADSILICSNTIEYWDNPQVLLDFIKEIVIYSPACIISTPERDLIKASGREFITARWNLAEFSQLLVESGLYLEHLGLTADFIRDGEKNVAIAVVGGDGEKFDHTFDCFKIVALMASFNEEDIIYNSVKRLMDEKIFVYVIDNWSTDLTYRIVKGFNGNPFFLGSERFPPKGPDRHFNLYNLMKRKEELAQRIEADWFINCDVDEVRESPWPETTLKEGIFRVDRLGYNAINHTELRFWPVDDLFQAGSDFHAYFKYCSFSEAHGRKWFHVKAWKNLRRPVSLAVTAGHEVSFEGRRVYPYNFLLKHYPVRSQRHGEKKVFMERKARYSPDERKLNWHVHYDEFSPGSSFISKPEGLLLFDDSFYRKYLLERLTGEIMRS